MRHNSTLCVQQVVAPGGKNEWGATVGAETDWSDPIPCHIRTLSDNRLGRYEDGIFHQASYNILALGLPPTIAAADVKKVRLTRRGVELGTFPVLSVETIETQNRIQIVV